MAENIHWETVSSVNNGEMAKSTDGARAVDEIIGFGRMMRTKVIGA
jgi:hypothetical protein